MHTLAGRHHLGEILPEQAARPELAAKPALLFDTHAYTYAQLDAATGGIAAHLAAAGVATGDAVALILPNAPALVAHLFAVLRLGAVVVPVNPSLTAAELAVLLRECAPRVVVTTAELAPRLHEALADAAPRLRIVDPAQPLDCRPGAPGPVATVPASAAAFLIYTAGTTGPPKGVLLSHGNVLVNTAQVAERTRITPADRVLHVMPLFHVNGLMNNTILPLRAGASIVLRPRFDFAEFWGVVARHRPTYFTAVPTIFSRLMDGWDGSADTSSLRFVRSGAAPMTPALQREVEERLGVPVVLSYGLSEATCTCTMNPPDTGRRLGSVGLSLRDEVVVAFDRDDQQLPPGASGEIAVRGPNVMAGYLGAPEATAQALRGGWLHTGDMGHVDADGFVFLTDRKKDLIVRGGENISPREVEDALLAHPAVAATAVVGATDREYGEAVCAFVVLRPGRAASAEELRLSCRERLARFKVPRHIRFVATLPVTSVGKIDKVQLRALAADAGPQDVRKD